MLKVALLSCRYHSQRTTEAKEGAVAADQEKIIGKHGKGDAIQPSALSLMLLWLFKVVPTSLNVEMWWQI